MRVLPFLFGVLLCLASPAWADPVDDHLRAELARTGAPGLSVAVLQRGQVLKQAAYGLANVELGTPARVDSVYPIGSVTKQFTAAAVMLLVGEGKVALDAPVSRYLADLPAAWQPITIRQLLNQVSGLPNYVTPLLQRDPPPIGPYPPAEIVKLAAGLPLGFPPGSRYEYSNTNYFVLGMVVEKVSGQAYGDFLRQRIFGPLGMAATRLDSPAEIIPGRVASYWLSGGTLQNFPYLDPSTAFAAGALVSTVPDLVRWYHALAAGKALPPAALRQMWSPGRLAGGQPTHYGFGWQVVTQNGHPLVYHSGSGKGGSAYTAWYPRDELLVIVLSNLDNARLSESIGRMLAGSYVPALAIVPEQPLTDTEPQVTALVTRAIEALIAGRADPALFTPEMRQALFPDKAAEVGKQLAQLGPLQPLRLLGRTEQGNVRVYRYAATFGTTTLTAQAALTPDNKVAGLLLLPE